MPTIPAYATGNQVRPGTAGRLLEASAGAHATLKPTGTMKARIALKATSRCRLAPVAGTLVED